MPKREKKVNKSTQGVEMKQKHIIQNVASSVLQEKENALQKKPMLSTEKEIAMDFATRVHEKFDRLVKATVLFGSQAKNTSTEKSDIDVIIIIDDASLVWDLELVAWYREELGKIIATVHYPRELHVNSVKLTTWWYDLTQGDPVVINILRYGEVLIDSGGFFNPLKILLQQGKIKGTVEAVYTSLQHAPVHLARSTGAKLGAIEGIYWCMIDAAQAALMTAGKLPPSPEHVPALLQEVFVDSGLLPGNYVNEIRNIYMLHKKIAHSEIKDVRGADIDRWQDTARSFLTEMTRMIDKLLEKKKK